MKKAVLTRMETGDEGTFGVLVTDSSFSCHTGELPWRDNDPNLSCIPEGTYCCTYRYSPKHGMCYHVENVPGRDVIEIHAANFMGDSTKGYKCELLGCIAPGANVAMIDKQKGILTSRFTLTALENALNHESFMLTIESTYA